jgi:hypothetical protein
MSSIPTFFNKRDFLGKLLPGYVAVILFIVLFYPRLLYFASTVEQNAQKLFSLDLFSIVIFIVAGPAVGYTLQTFHRNFYTIASKISNRRKLGREEEVKKYAKIIAFCNNEEKERLEEAEACYDFSISTSIIFTLLGIYYSVYRGSFEVITVPMFILSFILLAGGWIDRDETYWPLHDEIYRKVEGHFKNRDRQNA